MILCTSHYAPTSSFICHSTVYEAIETAGVIIRGFLLTCQLVLENETHAYVEGSVVSSTKSAVCGLSCNVKCFHISIMQGSQSYCC